MLILFSLIIIKCVSYYCITFALVICSDKESSHLSAAETTRTPAARGFV